jgi:hypothetical protein
LCRLLNINEWYDTVYKGTSAPIPISLRKSNKLHILATVKKHHISSCHRKYWWQICYSVYHSGRACHWVPRPKLRRILLVISRLERSQHLLLSNRTTSVNKRDSIYPHHKLEGCIIKRHMTINVTAIFIWAILFSSQSFRQFKSKGVRNALTDSSMVSASFYFSPVSIMCIGDKWNLYL